ncbi:hypothetical protein R1sor_021446 [Riccia sorocarpa]|uniref:PGG domain-containing protein n=1 Tax=Riccia sorocarpa TaxID=122646 RepID=A0ABD3GKF1_9MARC
MKDSSYRTVAHLILASESAPLDNLQLSLQYASKWEPVERQSWEYNGLICWLNLRLVHEVNGSVYFSTKSEIIVGGYRSLTFEQILLTSPHLTETDRTVRLESILKLGLEPRSCCLRPSVHAGVTSDRLFTPLQYYLLMGYSDLVQLMAEDDECYDPARINNQIHQAEGIFAVLPPNELCLHFMPKSALHLAAERADSEILRIILETGKFDPHFVDAEKGNTLLHPAARCEATTFLPAMLIDYVEIPEKFSSNSGVEQRPMIKDQQSEKEERHHESRRQGCVNLLLQEGLDIWETNKSGRIPGPGPKASPEYSLWWYEKLAHETQDQKTSFSAAATAISVTAALVATASYIGPLQPPLGYSLEDEDQIAKIQAEVLPVRVFFVCNTFAFYLAIAAVVFSLTPSLPMPHESTHGELNRIRRSVTSALVLLILSLVAILSAFASTSIVVIPNGKRWNHGWLTASSVIVGSIGCIVALIFSCTRAVRLLCHDNSIVSRIYSKWVCI